MKSCSQREREGECLERIEPALYCPTWGKATSQNLENQSEKRDFCSVNGYDSSPWILQLLLPVSAETELLETKRKKNKQELQSLRKIWVKIGWIFGEIYIYRFIFFLYLEPIYLSPLVIGLQLKVSIWHHLFLFPQSYPRFKVLHSNLIFIDIFKKSIRWNDTNPSGIFFFYVYEL